MREFWNHVGLGAGLALCTAGCVTWGRSPSLSECPSALVSGDLMMVLEEEGLAARAAVGLAQKALGALRGSHSSTQTPAGVPDPSKLPPWQESRPSRMESVRSGGAFVP